MMVSIQDRIVLIPGASSGIGASCAKLFAQGGAKLILAARRLERLEQMADNLSKEFSSSVHLLQLDVRDRSQVKSALQNIAGAWKLIVFRHEMKSDTGGFNHRQYLADA